MNRLHEMVELPSAEMWALIASMPPDQIADDDYVDAETGEVVLAAGKPAGSSQLHPQYQLDRSEKLSMHGGADLLSDDDFEEDDDGGASEKLARVEFESAVAEYASGFEGSSSDFIVDDEEQDLQGVSTDSAENFFHVYPQWKDWARALDMSKEEMRSFVAESVYEALMT